MSVNTLHSPEIQEVVDFYKPYLGWIRSWQSLTSGIRPVATGCGPVYEISRGTRSRPNESLAIADMRKVEYAQPHYHANGETEIYFVIQGLGHVVVGHDVMIVDASDSHSVVVIPPDTAHYALPDKKEGLVLAVVNTPPFDPENNIDLTASNPDVQFDFKQFQELTASKV